MSDERAQDESLPPHPAGKEPAEGGEVPDAGPGAERADSSPGGDAEQ
jgi:hypothetical protein